MMEDGKTSITFNQVRLPRAIEATYQGLAEKVLEGFLPSTVLVAFISEQPVAFIAIEEKEVPGSAWITDLVVAGAYRRQGIASALILAAQDWAVKRNLRRIVIELQSKNFPAIQLCMKLGYEFCGFHDHYYAKLDIALFFARFLH
jgi:ribosomal protein S18 acetylase RimI-like enzyme